jgi:hypothetical protein
MRLLFAFFFAALAFAPPARAADTIKFCTIGHMTFGSFADHIAFIKKANRYDKKEISSSNRRRAGRISS